MGIISSKHNSEVTKNVENPESTPKNARILPFDPRSPPDNFCRTPIAIVADTPSKDNETPVMRNVKSVFLDPRSPSTQVTRTPIVIEEQVNGKKYQPTKPSKLVDGNFHLTPTALLLKESDKDPRSPTIQVPRTPLDENNALSFPNLHNLKDIQSTENEKNISTLLVQENLKPIVTDSKPFLGEDLEKERRPLSCLQNKNATHPKKQIQALQCRSVEDEFLKNEKVIMSQLEKQEITLPTNTEFVEDI